MKQSSMTKRDTEKELFIFLAMVAAVDEIGHSISEQLSHGRKMTVNQGRAAVKNFIRPFKRAGILDQEVFDSSIEYFIEHYSELYDMMVRPEELETNP